MDEAALYDELHHGRTVVPLYDRLDRPEDADLEDDCDMEDDDGC